MFKSMRDFGGFWIKNLKFYPGHEGERCAYGSLYREGRRIGTFREDGWGGPMQLDITDPADHNALKGFAATLPLWEAFGGRQLPMTDELVIAEIIEAVEIINHYKKACRKECLFSVKGDDEGSLRVLKASYSGNEGAIRQHLDKKYGSGQYTIVNEELKKVA